MPTNKIHFENASGHLLHARLSLPVDQHPHSFAILAHCFTCTSNVTAIRQISRSLNLAGIGVLRFDFTGLGESEGEFEQTSFSSNISDLLAAARFLEREYQAPELLVGHSLGGAAVLCAAHQLPSVRAVATVGAPYRPDHVKHLFTDNLDQIAAKGVAEVTIGGRPFRISEEFVDDIEQYSTRAYISQLDKALLVMHSPQDRIVAVENAAWIYEAARHPKSFISLDGADHLLSDKRDANYAGSVIAQWSMRYLDRPDQKLLRSQYEVVARLGKAGFTTEIMVRHHSLTADEPERVGGNDFGPNPYELVSAGLASCTAMTLQMYARRKGWDLQEVIVHIDHRKDYADTLDSPSDQSTKIDHFERSIEVIGQLTEAQLARLAEIADRCPVHRTLHSEVTFSTQIKLLQ